MDIPPKTSPAQDAPKRKPGRPPGSSSAAPKSSSEVDQALATLDTAYQFLVLGLTMVGAPNAASDLAEKIAFVQEQTRGYLTADRKLAQRIAGIGSASGRAGFVVTNFMALAPVVVLASREIQARKPAPKVQAAPVDNETVTADSNETVTTAPVSGYGADLSANVG